MKGMHKGKVINFRFYFCLIIVLVILIALSISVFSSCLAKIIIMLALAVAAVAFIVLSIIFKKKYLYVALAIIFFAIIPVLNLYVRQNKVNKNLCFNGERSLVSGRICSKYSYTASGNLKITIDNLEISSKDNHVKPGGKFFIYVKPANLKVHELEIGNYIDVLCEPELYEMNGKTASSLSNGVIGRSFANFYDIEIRKAGDVSVKEKIKIGTFNKLKKWNVKHADVAYAMLFGESSFIDEDTLNIFRNTGVAHLLAVSGLHVSLIALLVSFILKKLKLSPYLNFAVILVLLILYSYLCNFSVSVVRASLMTSILLYCKARGKPYDRLSVLCFAASLILLVNPLKLVNISFLLSFSAVLSIILAMLPLQRFFRKFLYNKLADALSLCVAVQAGIIVVQLVSFGTYPVLSIFSNLISVPLESLAFEILLIGLPVSLILPFMSFLPRLFGLITNVVVRFNGFIASLGIIINFKNLGFVSIIFMFLILFILSDFVFVKKNKKIICSLCLVGVGVLAQTLLLIC